MWDLSVVFGSGGVVLYDVPVIIEGTIDDICKPEVLRPDCDLPPVSVADGYRAFDMIGPLVESMSFGKG